MNLKEFLNAVKEVDIESDNNIWIWTSNKCNCGAGWDFIGNIKKVEYHPDQSNSIIIYIEDNDFNEIEKYE